MGFVGGAILGAGQWLVRRGHVRHAARWVAANVLGWSIGLVVAFGGAGLATEGTPPAAIALLGALTGVMALAPALTTDKALLSFVSEQPEGPIPAPTNDLPQRLRRLDRWTRRLNPLVIGLLRVPLHRLISARSLLVTVPVGHGGPIAAFPVGYAVAGDDLAVIAGRSRRRWRSLSPKMPSTVCLCDRDRPVIGELVTDGAEVAMRLRCVPGLRGLTPIGSERW